MRRKSGFTLIEVLIVITIIGILSTLLIVGISHLKISANRQQTHQILQNCQALYASYDATSHQHIDTFLLPSPGNVSIDSENAYEAANNSTPANPAFGPRVGLMSVVTRALFTYMRSYPNIRSSMDQFPGGRMMLPTNMNGSYIGYGTSSQWAANQPYTAGLSNVMFAPPNAGSPSFYLCIHSHTSSDGTVTPSNAPPDTGCWFSLLADPAVPILKDAWDNPIIVVLGGQMGYIAGGPKFGGTGGGSGYVFVGGNQVIVTSPDNRLYFASAGPDGDFSKGDDNLYSFDPK